MRLRQTPQKSCSRLIDEWVIKFFEFSVQSLDKGQSTAATKETRGPDSAHETVSLQAVVQALEAATSEYKLRKLELD